METFLNVTGAGMRALLANHPVTRAEYKGYLQAAGQALPAALKRPEPPGSPVTYISQADALAYCRWAGAVAGRDYRLPTMAELQTLYEEDIADGISLELWPHTPGHMPELRGGLKQVFLCEWTGETEEIPQPAGRPPRVLGSIFYPPWLRHGSNAIHAQAHLLATEGYSFVTFRLACDH